MKVHSCKYLIVILMLISLGAGAQSWKIRNRVHRTEISFGIGATQFLGELGGANKIGSEALSMRDFDLPSVRPVFSFAYSYELMNRIGTKLTLAAGYLRGDDEFTKQPSRENRNISFRTMIFELSGQMEFLLTKARKKRAYYNLKNRRRGFSLSYLPVTTYAFVGIGVFYFNPEGKDANGQWEAVKQYTTEGEGYFPTRKNYSNVQMAIPFGFGIKYPMIKGFSVGLEYGIRLTFTDYIDDVSMTYIDEDFLYEKYGERAVQLANPSIGPDKLTAPGQQRGDPRDDDSYMFAIVSVYYDISKLSRIRNFRF